MSRKILKLNEAKLRRIISESVSKMINEHDVYDMYDDDNNDYLECVHQLDDIKKHLDNFCKRYPTIEDNEYCAKRIKMAAKCLKDLEDYISVERM